MKFSRLKYSHGCRAARMAPLMAAVCLAVAMAACFTGVESTPRITAADVRQQGALTTPEHEFLAHAVSAPVSDWTAGKRLIVTDSRAALALTGLGAEVTLAPGDTLVYAGMQPAVTVDGSQASDLMFLLPDGRTASYRVNAATALHEPDGVALPFTLDPDVVAMVDKMLTGQTYYILTPLWIDADGAPLAGRRYVPVTITAVTPGDDNYPCRVAFTDDRGVEAAVMMSTGHRRSATRNFDTLFDFDNPRQRLAGTTDRTWELITNSSVTPGMTRMECQLALGAPTDIERQPSTAGLIEIWTYDDGRYLVFEDGTLRRVLP